MRASSECNGKSQISRVFSRVLLLVCTLGFAVGLSTAAQAETHTLKLYYINTGEKTEVTFKKNGRYISSGLKKLDRFLRDWRRKESRKMDPRLYDLVWEIHKATRSRNRIHVVSAYRSPKTNAMLRRTRGGQAKKSQHMVGRAMDFYIPGVSSAKIRKMALQKGWGGVGYYPRSRSPYVHLDTGRVRHWPRMNRRQLVAVFPNGRTLHVPSDGKPLKGYKLAVADDKKRRSGKTVRTTSGGGSGTGLLAALGFGKGPDDDEDKTQIPAPTRVKTAKVPAKAPAPKTPVTIPGVAANPQPAFDPAAPAAGETEPAGPVVLPARVAAPRINPRFKAPTQPLPPVPTPDTPVVPDETVLVATAEQEPNTVVPLPEAAGAEPAVDPTLVALVTPIVPRPRPNLPEPNVEPTVEPALATEEDGLPEEQVLLAALPRENPLTATGTAQPASTDEASKIFASRLLLAHQAVDQTPSANALIAQLRRTSNLRAATKPEPVAKISVTPKAAPRPAAQPTPEPVLAAQPAPEPEERIVAAVEQPEEPKQTDPNALEIAEPQFDLASAKEFTRDGDMAIGRLNGATVLGWAITPLDPIRVKKRGLRAPAYGQNTLRVAPKDVFQTGFDPVGQDPRWTTLQKKPLTLAALN